MKLVLWFLVGATLFANDFYRGTSFQSYSGLINIPNAEVMHEGSSELLYSNQIDDKGINKQNYNAKNYLLNVGFFNFMELSGRLSELCNGDRSCERGSGNGGRYRDLSASAKIQLPYYNKYLPKLALGMQDIGSAAAHYESKYIVASKQLYFLNTTLGYAWDSDRMDGVFYGAEVKAFDWLYFLAEYDTDEYAAAVRLVTPSSLYKYVNLSFSIKKAFSKEITNNDTYFMAGVQFHLDKDLAKSRELKESLEKNRLNESDIYFESEVKEINNSIKQENILHSITIKKELTLQELQKKVADEGFENVRVGVHAKTNSLYIAYENSIYNTNELDAIGLILGYASSLSKSYKNFILEIKKSDQYIRTLQGSLTLCKNYYEEPTLKNEMAFANSLSFKSAIKAEGVVFDSEMSNSSQFKTRLELSPGVRSFVGTEYGNFDYLISLRAKMYWNLYSGLDFSISADLPFLESDDLDKKDGHYRKYNNGSQILDVMLHYNNTFYGIHNLLSVGQYQTNYKGFMDQAIYNYNRHTLKVKYARFWHNEFKNRLGTALEKESYLAKYSYFFEGLDMFVELQGGQYWNLDRGFDFDIKRFFGDTAVILRYQRTTPNEIRADGERVDQFAGLSIELPITPRRVESYRYAQIRGVSDFSYYLRTTIAREDGTNSLNPAGAIEPKSDFEIDSYLLNRNRLNINYLRDHISRFVDVYKTYMKERDWY